jgi:uncharacterized radical SAM protein YgiQ
MKNMEFLPATPDEARKPGINEFDVIIVTADAYVDHPAFGAAIIGRYLQSLGLTVGIIPQPDWRDTKDFTALGKPRLFFGVTAGNLDSMLSLYTPQRKIRSDDPYSENGSAGKRPYLPTIVYTNRIKQAFDGVPVVIGGIEASLRRVAHYDFYTDKVRPSILLDSKADLLVYGNAEAPLKEIVARLKAGASFGNIKDVRGTAAPLGKNEIERLKSAQVPRGFKSIPSFEQAAADKDAFCAMTCIVVENLNPYTASTLLQESGTRGVLINPPAFPLSTDELDRIYELPFTRKAHPLYKGKIPALEVVGCSVISHRGCYGGCNFCTLYLHQGKIIQSRSKDSVLREISRFAKGAVITDVGGPTANMYGTACRDIESLKTCRRRSCLYPSVCKNLSTSADAYLDLLDSVRRHPGVRAVYVNSGVRADLALKNPRFITELAGRYTQGHLSAAPEHCDKNILELMGKPGIETFDEFAKMFINDSRRAGKKQYIIPYFIIGHPGADGNSELGIAGYLQRHDMKVRQIQEFCPTPMSVSTAMYYTGKNPFTGTAVYVEKRLSQKKMWKKIVIGQRFTFRKKRDKTGKRGSRSIRHGG